MIGILRKIYIRGIKVGIPRKEEKRRASAIDLDDLEAAYFALKRHQISLFFLINEEIKHKSERVSATYSGKSAHGFSNFKAKSKKEHFELQSHNIRIE
mgnify:CR=1 FL=1